MAQPISNVHLQFNCNQNWDAIPATDGGRYCGQYQNFTGNTAPEYEDIAAQNNYHIRGRFKTQQLLSRQPKTQDWRKWILAVVVLIGFNFIAGKAQAQSKSYSKDSLNQTNKGSLQHTTPPNETFGPIGFDPVFPGGPEALNAFIRKNLDRSKAAAPVRVNVLFVIEKDGSLTNIKTLGRNQDTGAIKEAIRVIKLLPKWQPGTQHGKPVRLQYTIPVVF